MLLFIFKSCFKKVDWCWKRVKSFMPIVVHMGACLDCGLDFCKHVMLDVILIIWLVVFAIA
jgi:hypothetical protein